ncbi:MAG: hypothetical protein COU10_02565, partial [Candidatus Harrisonbacteria bacterium CG10_big_fil_rev_8_21_14_0_10_45_28]
GRAKEEIVKKTSLLDTRAERAAAGRAAAGRERRISFRATTRAARGKFQTFLLKQVRAWLYRYTKTKLFGFLRAKSWAAQSAAH